MSDLVFIIQLLTSQPLLRMPLLDLSLSTSRSISVSTGLGLLRDCLLQQVGSRGWEYLVHRCKKNTYYNSGPLLMTLRPSTRPTCEKGEFEHLKNKLKSNSRAFAFNTFSQCEEKSMKILYIEQIPKPNPMGPWWYPRVRVRFGRTFRNHVQIRETDVSTRICVGFGHCTLWLGLGLDQNMWPDSYLNP